MKIILIMSILFCVSYANNDKQINDIDAPIGVCKKIIGRKLPDTIRKNDKELYARLKSIGLSYWLGLSFEWLENEQNEVTRFLCLNIPQLDNAIKEIKIFIRQSTAYYNPNISSKSIHQALDIYDSPKYNAEVERIVKKYCKECK